MIRYDVYSVRDLCINYDLRMLVTLKVPGILHARNFNLN